MDTGGSFSGGVIAMLILKRRKIMIKRNIRILWGIALLQGMVFYAPVATLYLGAALCLTGVLLYWHSFPKKRII